MPLVLARIDDRLIHGQVTVGWATHLEPDLILLANNEIAADDWQTEVYSSSVPPHIKVSILSLAEAANELLKSEQSPEKILLLTGSLAEMAGLSSMGVPLRKINVGGLHFSPGKKEMLPFVYLGRQDFLPLRNLLAKDVPIHAQQVPGGFECEIDSGKVDEMEDLFR